MAYSKTVWADGGPPALSAENLNKIEDGIYNCDQQIDSKASGCIMAGKTGSITVAANSYVDEEISFDEEMPNVPTVVVSLISTSTAAAIGNISVAAFDITQEGFTARVFNAGSSQRIPLVSYIAYCEP